MEVWPGLAKFGKRRIILLQMITLFFILISFISCWFPFSHQYWTCLVFSGDVQKCFYDNTDISLTSVTLGGSSPDAFKKIGLHNLYYALFQYFYARDQFRIKTVNFDAESFSLGYIFHLVEDMIGHRRPGGFINEAEDFNLCVSVDSYHFYDAFDTKHFFPAKYFNGNSSDFVYFAQVEYGKEYPTKYPKVASRSEIDSGTLELEGIITGEKEIVKLFKSMYQDDLEKESTCGIQSWDNVLKELDLSYNFMSKVSQSAVEWVKESKDIQGIIGKIENLVDTLFKDHNNTICV